MLIWLNSFEIFSELKSFFIFVICSSTSHLTMGWRRYSNIRLSLHYWKITNRYLQVLKRLSLRVGKVCPQTLHWVQVRWLVIHLSVIVPWIMSPNYLVKYGCRAQGHVPHGLLLALDPKTVALAFQRCTSKLKCYLHTKRRFLGSWSAVMLCAFLTMALGS